jgi:hypothetical protein
MPHRALTHQHVLRARMHDRVLHAELCGASWRSHAEQRICHVQHGAAGDAGCPNFGMPLAENMRTAAASPGASPMATDRLQSAVQPLAICPAVQPCPKRHKVLHTAASDAQTTRETCPRAMQVATMTRACTTRQQGVVVCCMHCRNRSLIPSMQWHAAMPHCSCWRRAGCGL